MITLKLSNTKAIQKLKNLAISWLSLGAVHHSSTAGLPGSGKLKPVKNNVCGVMCFSDTQKGFPIARYRKIMNFYRECVVIHIL